jgi:hypothetical protein
MPNKTEIIEHIPLSAIAVDLEWNARSGAWMDVTFLPAPS